MMKIIEKIITKQKDIHWNEPVTIAFFGDSVTQGCFEYYHIGNNVGQVVVDEKSGYPTRLRELLGLLYPRVPINMIYGGLSGGHATHGVHRLERDILQFSPDLVIVSFGLNDCTLGDENLEKYADALREIFGRCKEIGAEVIFLTQNYACTKVKLTDPFLVNIAKDLVEMQNSGRLGRFFDRAKEVCRECDVEICDLYSVWETMEKAEVEVTDLLAGGLNHPVRPYHQYIAVKLLEKMMGIH